MGPIRVPPVATGSRQQIELIEKAKGKPRVDDRSKIANSVSRFMTCFDTKDWDEMSSALGDPVRIDYSDLRGQPPSTISRAEYITARESAHGHTKTHHLISNFDVRVTGDHATVKASCMIYRAMEADYFNSHALYEFGLERDGDDWLIVSITQEILWNDGNPQAHSGVPNTTKPA